MVDGINDIENNAKKNLGSLNKMSQSLKPFQDKTKHGCFLSRNKEVIIV